MFSLNKLEERGKRENIQMVAEPFLSLSQPLLSLHPKSEQACGTPCDTPNLWKTLNKEINGKIKHLSGFRAPQAKLQ